MKHPFYNLRNNCQCWSSSRYVQVFEAWKPNSQRENFPSQGWETFPPLVRKFPLCLLHLEASKRQIIPKALGMVPRGLIEKHKQDRKKFSTYFEKYQRNKTGINIVFFHFTFFNHVSSEMFEWNLCTISHVNKVNKHWSDIWWCYRKKIQPLPFATKRLINKTCEIVVTLREQNLS